MKKINILIVALLLVWGIVFTQTQEEKEKLKKEKVITNQTLRELKSKISVIGKEEETTEGTKEEIKEAKEGESAKGILEKEVKDEQYWRNLKKEIEDRIIQAEKKVENLKNELDILYRDFYNIDDPARREQIQAKIVETTRKLEEAQEELEKAKKELEDFRERARKEGALPGWIR